MEEQKKLSGQINENSFEENKPQGNVEVEEKKTKSIFFKILRILTWDEICDICSISDTAAIVSLTKLIENEIMEEVEDQSVWKEKMDEDEGGIESRQSGYSDHQIQRKDGKAKILPFSEKPEKRNGSPEKSAYSDNRKEDEGDVRKMSLDKKTDIELHEDGSFDICDHEAEEEKKKKEEEKVNVGEFILRQKEKFKDCQRKLKKKEIYELYRDNSAIEPHRDEKEDFSVNGVGNKGILVNKRQK